MKKTKRSKLLIMYYNLRIEWKKAVNTVMLCEKCVREEWNSLIARLELRLTNLLIHIEKTKYVCVYSSQQ